MKTIILGVAAVTLAIGTAWAQEIIVNPDDTKWKHEANGSESIVLNENSQAGGLELFARYPAGHVFAPHWHDSNERILLIEGRLSIGQTTLEPGGFAYLPARQLQTMTCVSKTRCAFYVSWDGNPASRKGTPPSK